MKIRKLPYYLKSFLLLCKESKNKLFFIFLYPYFTFKNNLKFEFKSFLDLLILKETIIDDYYQLKKSIKNNPKTIVDIGGGFGDFSIYAAKMFPDAKILVFEPNPILYKMLLRNITLNEVKNIDAFPTAVSSKKELILDISKEPTQTSIFFNDKKQSRTIKVKTKNLSGILKDHIIDFLKIDCEGGEWNILSNLSDQEFKRIKIISLEYHNQYIPNLDKKIIKQLGRYFKILRFPDLYNKDIGNIYADKELISLS